MEGLASPSRARASGSTNWPWPRATTACRWRRCATTSLRPGLHYVLTHYDIPAVDPASWRLSLGGAVERSASLSLQELQQRPTVTARVLLECAGNGRARLEPRPVSQPWLLEAVGSAEWTGTPAGAPAGGGRPVLRRGRRRLHRRRPRRGARRRAGLHARAVAGRGDAPRRPPGLGHERRAAPPAARRSPATARTRLVRDGAGEVAVPDRGARPSRTPGSRTRPPTGSRSTPMRTANRSPASGRGPCSHRPAGRTS